MGIRIAKLDTGYEGLEMWAVYQSVTDALFAPIFYDELSAEIYAHHYYEVEKTSLDWVEEYHVGELVMEFVRLLYGDEPENHVDYPAVLAAIEMDETGMGELHNLWSVFAGWRIDQSKTPVFELAKEEGGQ